MSARSLLYRSLWLITFGSLVMALVATWALLIRATETYPPVIHVPQTVYFDVEQ